MPKMTEEQKAARRQQREDQRIARELQEAQEKLDWEAGYAERVKEFRKSIKDAGFSEKLVVDDNLNIRVCVDLSEDSSRVWIDDEDYYVTDQMLTRHVSEFEYRYMLESLDDIVKARDRQAKYLDQVRAFKASFTPEQLKLIGDFHKVR